MNDDLYTILSFLPVFSLGVISLLKNIKYASIISFIITAILFFLWGNSVSFFGASLIVSLISTLNILMIVFGALFLYHVMEESRIVEEIKLSLYQIHPSKEILFFFIIISLTGFFEGVAGFGTPGTIVPVILISLGFNPIISVASVLLLDGLYSAFGAVGTPLIAGMQSTLKLTPGSYKIIGLYSALILSLVGIFLLLFIFHIYQREYGKMKYKKEVWLLYGFFITPFILFSWLATDLSTVLASVFMITFSILYLSTGKVKIKPWYPYIILVVMLLLPKMSYSLNDVLNFDVKLENLLKTGIGTSFQPLKSPLIPFLIVSLLVIIAYQIKSVKLNSVFDRVAGVFLVLFPIISVSQMMLNSGSVNSSMINLISHSFAHSGNFYLIISPFIGMVGSFITGSTTVSNIVFSTSQLEIANILSFNSEVILSLQHSGATIGNAICLFNIIAAGSVAGIKDENKILKLVIKPSLVAGLTIGLCGFILLSFLKI